MLPMFFLLLLTAKDKPVPVYGHADPGANITFVYELGPECLVKGPDGQPKITITKKFHCSGPDIDHMDCSGFVIPILKDCASIRVIHPELKHGR